MAESDAAAPAALAPLYYQERTALGPISPLGARDYSGAELAAMGVTPAEHAAYVASGAYHAGTREPPHPLAALVAAATPAGQSAEPGVWPKGKAPDAGTSPPPTEPTAPAPKADKPAKATKGKPAPAPIIPPAVVVAAATEETTP